MEHWLSRTELLIGKENLDKLANPMYWLPGWAVLAVMQLNNYAGPVLVSSHLLTGILVTRTNRNRQIIALTSNEGMSKARHDAETPGTSIPISNCILSGNTLRKTALRPFSKQSFILLWMPSIR